MEAKTKNSPFWSVAAIRPLACWWSGNLDDNHVLSAHHRLRHGRGRGRMGCRVAATATFPAQLLGHGDETVLRRCSWMIARQADNPQAGTCRYFAARFSSQVHPAKSAQRLARGVSRRLPGNYPIVSIVSRSFAGRLASPS